MIRSEWGKMCFTVILEGIEINLVTYLFFRHYLNMRLYDAMINIESRAQQISLKIIS